MHERAKEIPLSIEGETHIGPNPREWLTAPRHRLAVRAGGIHHSRSISVRAEQPDALAGDNAIAPKRLRHMAIKIHVSSSRASAAADRT